MKPRSTVALLLAACATAFCVGTVVSGQSQEAPEGKPAGPPLPPAELKALDAFVGEWRSVYEFTPAFMGESGTGTGFGTSEWVLGNWFLKTTFKATGDMGEYEMIGMLTYDPVAKIYRSYSFESYGMVEEATMTYEPGTKTWTTLSDGIDYQTGKPLKNRYVMRFVSPDKLEWDWSIQREGETDFALAMKGTDTRVSAPQRK